MPDFKTIFAGVRATRVAVLMDSADPDWRETCRRIIEWLSSLWGGKYSLIIPTDGIAISPLFWRLLEAFDPDRIVRYQKTVRDFKLARADEYLRIREDNVKAVFRDEEVSEPNLKEWEERFLDAPWGSFGITLQLEAELKQRLAPFYLDQHVTSYAVRAHGKVQYPLTDVSVILPHCQQSDRVAIPDPTGAGVPPLWVEAVTGALNPTHEKCLAENGVRKVPVMFDYANASRLFRFILTGSTRSGLSSFEASLEDVQIGYGPFRYSMIGLSEYMPSRPEFSPMVVVCGSELDDFALYFSLSRLCPNVCWLLREWVDEFKKARDERGDVSSPLSDLRPAGNHADFSLRYFAQALLSCVDFHAKSIEFVSATSSVFEINDFVDCLDAAAHWGKGRIKALARLSGVDTLLKETLVAFNTDNYAVPVSQHFPENRALPFFPTPKPKGFSSIVPFEHRWITELRIDESLYPRNPALGEWLVRDRHLGTDGARAGSRGLCYSCPTPMYLSGGDVDTILIRPTIYIPQTEEMVEHLAHAAGWTTRVSDKGFYSRETALKFAGLEATAKFLRAPHKRSVLEEFLRPRPDADGQTPHAKFLSSDHRWYIDFERVVELTDQGGATALLDFLVGSEILYRGLILKCQFCRNADWFPLGEMAEGFRCKRCRREQKILSRHSLQNPIPVWYYALDEIVYQGMRSDMAVPLLALDALRKESASFLYTEEVEVWKPGAAKPLLEIDLCCIPDGILTIGEAKKTERIERGGVKETSVLANYREIALAMGVRQFVLATSRAWGEQTIRNAKDAFRDTPISVRILDQSKLFAND